MNKPEFLRFLLTGGIAAAANFGSRFIFSSFFSYSIAVLAAYLVGMFVAFILMRGHVFNVNQGNLKTQVAKFVGVNVLAVLQTLAISLFIARWAMPSVGITEHAEALGHLVGVIIPVVTSYFGHKYITFR